MLQKSGRSSLHNNLVTAAVAISVLRLRTLDAAARDVFTGVEATRPRGA